MIDKRAPLLIGLIGLVVTFSTKIASAELAQLQKKAQEALKQSKALSQDLLILNYLQQKFSGGVWSVSVSSPTLADIPRLEIKRPAVLAPAPVPTFIYVPLVDDSGHAYQSDDSGLASLQVTSSLLTSDKQAAIFSFPPENEDLPAAVRVQKFTDPTWTLATYVNSLGTDAEKRAVFPHKKLTFERFILKRGSTDEVGGVQVKINSNTYEVPIEMGGQVQCGFPAEDNKACLSTKPAKLCGCYDHTEAMVSGLATLKDGTEIVLVNAAVGSGFKVWREKNGNRILKSTGLWASPDDWQKKLTQAGTGFTDEPFTVIAQLSGRVCPPNVFLSHSNMTATDRCLYYDVGRASQLGGGPSMDPSKIDSGGGRKHSFFETNVLFCQDKSMRLPTAFETTLSGLSRDASIPTGDGISPVFAGPQLGVPSVAGTFSFTASPSLRTGYGKGSCCIIGYWKWNGGSDYWGQGYPSERNTGSIRCVLP